MELLFHSHAIPGCKISVDKLAVCQILHSFCDLVADSNKFCPHFIFLEMGSEYTGYIDVQRIDLLVLDSPSCF